ncbi:Calx-beta domain-containing protein [Luteolibacter algae]|uniref:Calx-beta domain-containing protein n=1 Tax=Luteolibacter algae TaxID=454151 RepID=A0ABW5DAF3_9BACT
MKITSGISYRCGLVLLFLAVILVIWKKPNSEEKTLSESRRIQRIGSQDLLSWSEDFHKTSEPDKAVFISDGVRLAKLRTAALAELAATQPALALGKMMTLDQLAALPPAVREASEKPFSAIGSIDLLWETSVDASGSLHCSHRNVALVGGKSLTIVGPDFESARQPMTQVPLNGYLLGEVLLLSDQVVRTVSEDELEAVSTFFPASDSLDSDPLTHGRSSSATTAVIGGKYFQFESDAILQQVEDNIAGAIETAQSGGNREVNHGFSWLMADSGMTETTRSLQATPFQADVINVLFIRADFSDLPGAPITKAKLETDLNAVKNHIEQYSYGKASLNFTVTPDVYRLASTASAVSLAGNNDAIITEARTAAATGGSGIAPYDLNNYNVVAVYFPNLSSLPQSKITYGGLASVGGSNHWVNGVSDFGRVFVILHEFGHNYGLNHANYYDPSRTTPGQYFDPLGVSNEYGDIYDTMGGGTADKGYFSPYAMSRLNWMPGQNIVQPEANGTWRIHRFDQAAGNTGQVRALRVPMGGSRYNWVGLRSLYDETKNRAYIVGEGIYENRPNLIDATPDTKFPESEDRTDSTLPVGSSFYDASAGVRFTNMAAGGSDPDLWIDMKVEFDSRLELDSTNVVVDEAAGHARLVVKRSFDVSKACSVSYTTTNGTAVSGSDFHETNGKVSWAAGDSSPKTILIPIRPDALEEGTETFSLALSGASNAIVPSSSGTATISILDRGSRITGFDPVFFGTSVYTALPLANDQVLIGGNISNFGLQGNIARLNADGSEDTSFLKGTGFNNDVRVIVEQSDGKLLVGGSFTSYNGINCNRVTRLNANGTIDTTFNSNLGSAATRENMNPSVYALALESNGSILIGGNFTSFNGSAANGIVRRTSTGTAGTALAPAFSSPTVIVPDIRSILVEQDGKIMIAGLFSLEQSSGTLFRFSVARLNANGSRDASFEPGGGAQGLDDAGVNVAQNRANGIYSLVRQSDGKYLIGGFFRAYNNVKVDRLARLNNNGTLDTSFTPPLIDNVVERIFVDMSNRILIGGRFTSPSNRIISLTSTGAIDSSFQIDSGAGGSIYTIAQDGSGDIYLGGNFFDFAGSTSRPIIKLAGGVDSFSLWKKRSFTSAQIIAGKTGPEEDFDNDGILNITEMALGTSPTLATSATTFAVASGNLSLQSVSNSKYLEATMLRSAENIGVWLVAQFSSDLINWSPSVPTRGSNGIYDVVESNGSRFTVRDKTAMSSTPRFVRFRAILPN